MPDEMTKEERRKLREERRRRRRQRLDRALSTKTMAILYMCVLIAAILLLVIPRPKESQIEKRDLARFPKFSGSAFLSGEFTHGITTWYDDTIPFRDHFKNVNNGLKNRMGLHSEDTVEIVGNVARVDDRQPADTVSSGSAESVGDMQKEAEDTAVSTSSAEAPDEDINYEKEEADGTFDSGFLIINQDGHWRGLPLFAGGDGADYASFLNDLRAQTDDSVRIYSMPIPLASAYYLPSNFSEYSVDQDETFQGIFAMQDPGITPIDLIDVLGAHEDEDIFLRTDHHWTALGAWYACQALAEEAGLPFLDLDAYHRIDREGYVGSMYGYTQSANLLNDPETFTILIPPTPYMTAYHDPDYTYSYMDDLFVRTDTANSYMAFHAGDSMIIHTVTATKNGRKLLILKDSYGDPMPGLLTGTFEEIFSADLRFCTVNLLDFIREQGITDVVAAMDIDTVAYPTADLNTLLTQAAGWGIPDDEPEEMRQITDEPGSPYYADAVDGNDPLLVE